MGPQTISYMQCKQTFYPFRCVESWELQTQLQSSFRIIFSYISFSSFTFSVYPTRFLLCFFPYFLAIFILLSSNNNKSLAIVSEPFHARMPWTIPYEMKEGKVQMGIKEKMLES